MKKMKSKNELSEYFVSKAGNLCVYARIEGNKTVNLYKVTGLAFEGKFFNHKEVK